MDADYSVYCQDSEDDVVDTWIHSSQHQQGISCHSLVLNYDYTSDEHAGLMTYRNEPNRFLQQSLEQDEFDQYAAAPACS
ncbi:hypothetical protein DD238_000630 [Peronospora effusa]|uniref:Uncharacterized protein n=1 Tax=Peronospora effusa TaxID=542832 RepID=A0A3M6VTF6_9STRA|nr:hypothetical protein DD238_000630 [Peronospora effusa]RQM17286.1 hypothetical protein DD237_000766 [Peronospora effusa]